MNAPRALSLAPVLVAAALLTSCSAVSDAVGEQVDSAACSVATSVGEQVANQVGVAAGDIQVDPSGAVSALESVRSTVDGAAAAATGGVQDALESVSGAVTSLIETATLARDGGSVSDEQIAELEAVLAQRLTDLTAAC